MDWRIIWMGMVMCVGIRAQDDSLAGSFFSGECGRVRALFRLRMNCQNKMDGDGLSITLFYHHSFIIISIDYYYHYYRLSFGRRNYVNDIRNLNTYGWTRYINQHAQHINGH